MQLVRKSVPKAPHSAVDFTRRNGGKLVHNWPSNFWIEPDGTCVEVEFQSDKHDGHPWRQFVIQRKGPGPAKRLATTKWKLTPVELALWDERRVDVMFDRVLQKVLDWPAVGKLLERTGDKPLVEFNWWHDNFWGWCVCDDCRRELHQNWLGETWMKIRKDIA